MKSIVRHRDVGRIEGFSDAVFAFAATLLVVSLDVPDTFAELLVDLSGFAAFAVSFFVLIVIWSVHAAFFRRFQMSDRVTIALNAGLLFVILFYVYPLKFVARGMLSSFFGGGEPSFGIATAGDLSTLFLLYSGGFASIFLFVSLLYAHAASKHRVLGLSAAKRAEAWIYTRHYLILTGVGLLSAGLASAHVGLHYGLPGFIYAGLGPACWWHGVWSKRRSERMAPRMMPTAP